MVRLETDTLFETEVSRRGASLRPRAIVASSELAHKTLAYYLVLTADVLHRHAKHVH